MKHLKKLTVIFLILLINITVFAQDVSSQKKALPNEKELKEIFREAKRFIYSKDWQKAVRQFKKIAEDFPKHKLTDDSLYWLGYSLNKMSQNSKGLDQALEAKTQALKSLAVLMEQFPDGKWTDDAKCLTVEIAEELVQRGLKDYERYILSAMKEDTEAELKAIALVTLLEMNKEKAFPYAVKIIKSKKDANLRKKAIFALAQMEDSRVIPLLVEVVSKDPDKKVREQAIFWLGQTRNPEGLKQLIKLYNGAEDLGMKKKLIFSIAQFSGEKAVKELIRIYKKEKNMELKKQVIFWLGQSKNKEAREFILKILE